MNAARRILVAFSFALPPVALGITSAAGAVAAPARSASISAHIAVDRINAIRRADGLSTGTATTAYGAQLDRALIVGRDPDFGRTAPDVVGGYSLWGAFPQGTTASLPSPSAIVDAWVDHDGWTGSVRNTWNVDCTSARSSGCDGHRQAILSTPPVPGARLLIDAATRVTESHGVRQLSLVTLLIWQLPAKGSAANR